MRELTLAWRSPLPLQLVPTSDSESFRSMPPGFTGLPVGEHPGAFSVRRRHHIHEGVDLYCPEGTPVSAVEEGVVLAVMPFTGPRAGLPWWLDTDVVLVEGPSGVVAYGELIPQVRVGAKVCAGELIGHVTRVLRNDKGRPTSMLHLELHSRGASRCSDWSLDSPRPHTLRDPTPHLLRCCELPVLQEAVQPESAVLV